MPPPTVADLRSSATVTEFKARRSISKAWSTNVRPSRLCPPLRRVNGIELDLANVIMTGTSDGDCGWTMARGTSVREQTQTSCVTAKSGQEGGMYLMVGWFLKKASTVANWVVPAMLDEKLVAVEFRVRLEEGSYKVNSSQGSI